ncbi:hybrid sensor histidine kinase/response regulator [Oceanibaculum pacificum]|uniref:Chemotaxis protein CheA n=1 Tax=Oceanibaculum pacificum TaxID=580166 RepID=A0A154VY17_9PROT|nr:response regulator [Oceanibaculum pacificum]KZD06196.1 hypothetical protein AUP43_11160 [Oceanibaculum pacificum]
MTNSRREALRQRLLETFAIEAAEHLGELRHIFDQLAATDAAALPASFQEAFRVMHTLKGAARSVGLKEIEAVGHACEELLQGISSGVVPSDPERLRLLADSVELIAAIQAGQAAQHEIDRHLMALGGTPAIASTPASADVGFAVESPVDKQETATATEASPENALEAALVVHSVTVDESSERQRPKQAGPRKEHLPSPGSGPARLNQVRIGVGRLDELIYHAEGLHQPVTAMQERLSEVKHLVSTLASIRRSAAVPSLQGEEETARPPDLQACERQARDFLKRLSADQHALRYNLDAVMDDARRLRMVPVSSILEALPDMVRDIAAATEKEARWQVSGADIEIDRRILQTLKDPILHIVRNAVAHGIEFPEERIAAGKPRTGRIVLTAAVGERNTVTVTIADDGRGLDLAAIRRTAVARGLLSEERAAALVEADIPALLWSSGFSTSAFISDLAGRGVGLSVVKDRVENLGGSVAISSRPNVGMSITLTLPNSLSLLRGLLVRSGGQPFLIPATAVECVLRASTATIAAIGGRQVLRQDGRDIPVADLASVLESDASREAPSHCIVLQTERPVAILVDTLVGVTSVLPRTLGEPLDRVRNVSGATLLPSGEIAFILRATDIAAGLEAGLVVRRNPTDDTSTGRPETVLVVDDSVTTRIMEKNLLEASGYEVRIAKHGLDALDILKRERIDIIVSDVDMPVMDGFELTSRVRADPALSGIPVILVTALESPEDKRRGMDLGANAYIVKSQFDESQLLDIVRRVT